MFLTTTTLGKLPKHSDKISCCMEILRLYSEADSQKLLNQDFFNLRKAIYILCLPNIEKNPQITKRTELANNFMEEIKKGNIKILKDIISTV